MFRKIALGAVALAIVGTAGSAQAQDKIRLGFMTPLSGPLTFLGKEQLMGMELALEKLGNKLGGIPVEVIKQDGRMSAATANQAATKLVEQGKIDILTGLLLSNQTIAITKSLTDKGIFVISGVSGPKPLAGAKCNRNFFAISWQNEQASEALGKFLTEKGVKSVFAISQNYVAGRDHVAGVWAYYKGKRVGEAYVPRRHMDYAGEIAQIRSIKPQAIFMFLPGRGGIAFLKQMNGAGLMGKIKVFGGSWVADEHSFKAVGDSALGAELSNPWWAQLDNPTNKAFVAAFHKKHGRNPVFYAAFMYDVINLLDAAVKEAGGIKDKDKFRAALRRANFKSVRGAFKFNTNHFPVQDFYIGQVVKSKKGLTHKIIGKPFTAQGDRYAKLCKM
ncbi:MAG: ABC transporter substrate-binding protein [Alphaproteobacteria bacterium]|nr:ABC transporter substrate-binding protein [Alphaproteobacteria bacterium]